MKTACQPIWNPNCGRRRASFAAIRASEPVRLRRPRDRDEYLAENIFWVPRDARWEHLQQQAKSPEIGVLIDRAMASIEKENPMLRGVLPQDYGREGLDKCRLGELIDLISTISMGDKACRTQDILGQVYEYFLGQYDSVEGKKGGQFYTPISVVTLLVEMLEPYQGRVYDPCCGSGGMFVQSEQIIEQHGARHPSSACAPP